MIEIHVSAAGTVVRFRPGIDEDELALVALSALEEDVPDLPARVDDPVEAVAVAERWTPFTHQPYTWVWN